jgi:hypothetical protein
MMFDLLLVNLERELRASLDTCVTGMVATARAQVEAALAEVAKERAKGLAEVARERTELHREMESMQTHQEAQEGRVELNIGGRRFETSVQTLRRVPHTFFDAYFSGRYAQDVCADGSIFVDRDGEHFGHILEYMRDGVVSVAAQEASELDIALLRVLKREFGFYCIELMAEKEEVVFDVGGHTGDAITISALHHYDKASGIWLKGAPMATARASFGLCELGGMLYVSGGFYSEEARLASVECYDPTLDIWSVAPALPRDRSGHCACTVADAMYVLGGICEREEGGILVTRSVLKFDSITQAWCKVALLPKALDDFDLCVIGSNIYIFGGAAEDGRVVPTAYRFDTATNSW